MGEDAYLSTDAIDLQRKTASRRRHTVGGEGLSEEEPDDAQRLFGQPRPPLMPSIRRTLVAGTEARLVFARILVR